MAIYHVFKSLKSSIPFSLLVFLLLNVFNAAQSKDVFIDPTYQGYEDGSLQSPFNSWNDVSLNSSDNYYQKCGTTTDSKIVINAINASSSNNLVIGSYHIEQGKPVLGLKGNRPIILRGDYSGSVIKIINSKYITIENIDIRKGKDAIYCMDSDNLTFQNNNIGEGTKGYGLRIVAANRDLKNCIILNNTFDSKIASYGQIPEKDIWDAIMIYNSAYNYLIRNNYIRDWGHTGINLWSDSTSYSISNCEISHNYIDGINSLHFRGFEIMGKNIYDNKVHHNYISNMNSASKVEGIRTLVYRNVVNGVINSGITKDGVAFSLSCDRGKSHSNKIFNNVIYNTENAAIRLLNLPVSNFNLEYNEIYNNIMFNTGKGCADGCKQDYPIFVNNVDDNTYIQKNSFINNLIYNSNEKNLLIKYQNVPKTVAEFNLMNNTDGNIIKNNNNGSISLADFSDPTKRDFSLKESSKYFSSGVGIPKGEIVGPIKKPSILTN